MRNGHSFEELPLRQRQAISAYQGGFISLGKLAKEMGMHVVDLNEWMADRGIPQQTAFGPTDADRA